MALQLEQAELLARVAHLYFEKDQDQGAIARRLRVSRSSVSRLLAQARRQGIVEIRINYPLPLANDLARSLTEHFALQEAWVLKAARHEGYNAKAQIARLAAYYLRERIGAGEVIAISRGSTLHAVVEQFSPLVRRGVRVVQLVGTLSPPSVAEDEGNLAQLLARKLDAEYYNLTAPLFVENVETRVALLQEPSIRQVLDLARHASLALVGIGALAHDASSISRRTLLSRAQIEELRKAKAVGEICSQYFDIHGERVSHSLSERTIALELTALREIPTVIGVAVGKHKAQAILGALQGRLINVMITDDVTAAHVLEWAQRVNAVRRTPYASPPMGWPPSAHRS